MKKGEKTKNILLNSACELFAGQGFYKTTMRDITDAANTNVAAVNYHFGDKETLYFESFKHAAQVEAKLLLKASQGSSDPQKLLEKTIYIRLVGLTQKNKSSWLIQMFHHEVLNPSAMHEKIVKEVMFKQKEKLRTLIKAFFEMDLSAGQFDVIFSCFLSPMLHQLRRNDRVKQNKKLFPIEYCLDDISDEERIHMIVTYIISGLEGLKKEFKNENS